MKCNTNLWHQRIPHPSCQLTPVQYSADTNEWRCAFVMILRVRTREKKTENLLLDLEDDRQGRAINHRTRGQTIQAYLFNSPFFLPFGLELKQFRVKSKA